MLATLDALAANGGRQIDGAHPTSRQGRLKLQAYVTDVVDCLGSLLMQPAFVPFVVIALGKCSACAEQQIDDELIETFVG